MLVIYEILQIEGFYEAFLTIMNTIKLKADPDVLTFEILENKYFILYSGLNRMQVYKI
jgi:hypothetical protein